MFNRKLLLFLLTIVLVILLHLLGMSILAQGIGDSGKPMHEHYYVYDQTIPTFTVEQDGLEAKYPDWRKITFSRLKGIIEGGELLSEPSWDNAVGYSLSRIWNGGDSPAEFLKLGDFQDSLVEGLNLEYILSNSLTELDFKEIPLSALELMNIQTIDSLVEAIPQLRNLSVQDIKPILALVGEEYAYNPIESLVGTNLGDIPLGELNLNNFYLGNIPLLLETPLSSFEGWQNSFLDQVPGLWDLPFNFLFGDGIFTAGLLAKADLVFGTAEGGLDNTISGSYQEGFHVPCEEECAHVELALGKRWISGKYQKVEGGRGILGLVNGGKEPTGRHPFGSAFKVAVWDTNESDGSVDTALFFRYCQKKLFVDLGCTPYFIGPIPFLSYHEKDNMIIGLLDGSGGSSDNNPMLVPPTEEYPLPPENASGLIDPLPGSLVTSEWGYRGSGFHEGIDEAFAVSDSRYPGQIIASGSGFVTKAGPDSSGCGTLIIINHGNGLKTGYCHMTIYVTKGSVQQGQVIGQVSNEGRSTGPHLHFMVYENGRKVNPRKYVNF